MANFPAHPRRDGARSLLLMALTSVSALAFNAEALAQSVEPASRIAAVERNYDIPAQPLSSALLRFAEQSDLQILFSQEDVAGMSSRPVHGRLSPDTALAQLLPDGAPQIEIVGDRVVRTDLARPQFAGADEATTDEEIVVTGTRIRGAHPAGSHLDTLSREDIEQTGRATVQDVLQTLPQNFPGSQNEGTQLGSIDSGRNLAFGSTVDLRGLGADATLTLLNGRRLAPAGWGNFVDISSIPLAAVDRIEVLADGASATYGSDAVAGVVNVILRRDFEGAETALRYGASTRGEPEEIGFSQVFGAAWQSGSAMIGYEYRDRSELLAADRDFAATSDLRPWGGSNFSSNFSNPGNITRIGATNVVLAIPEGQDGASLAQADLLPGVINYRPFNEDNFLLPRQTSNSVFASLRQHVTPDLEVFADLLASRRNGASARWQNNVTLVVPETNAYRVLNNLFPGQGALRIAYNMGEDLGPTRFDTESEALSVALGAGYTLPRDWRIEASVALSHNDEQSVQSNVFGGSALLAGALASANLATAFNPFADGSNTPAGVLEGLTFDDTFASDSEIVTYALKADGPLFEMWGGAARLAIGIERREETFELLHSRRGASNFDEDVVAPAARTTDALFAELYLPLVGPGNRLPGVHALDLSMSVRREEASDFGEATTPKLGLTWGVNEDLALRASWGQSFKAPQFQQLFGGVGGTLTSVPAVLDPFATDGSTGILILAGTNADLTPETAQNWTAGFDFNPHWAPGFALHATYYDIDFVDRISDPGSVATALANPTGFENVFFRNPTQAQIDHYLAIPNNLVGSIPPDGVEVIWDGRLTNLASLRVRGVDLNAAYAFDTGFGHIELFASASLMLQYTVQGGPTSTPLDGVDTMFYPVDLRARVGGAWSLDNWSASITANYVDAYRDEISAPARRVASWTTWDLQLNYVWGENLAEDPGPQIRLNIQNLFDEDPPFANNPAGYAFDSRAAGPIGRLVSVELRQRW